MTDMRAQRTSGPGRGQPSAYGLLMNYERALTDAVEATIARGLRRSRATVDARAKAAAAWREPLTIIAAEELSRRLAAQASRGTRSAVSPSSLARALSPYAALVAVAAQTEMAHQPHEFVAAD
jgi:hypothetical protein